MGRWGLSPSILSVLFNWELNEETYSVLRKEDSDGLSFQECLGNAVFTFLELFPPAHIAQLVVGALWLKDILFNNVQLIIHWDPGVLFSCSASPCQALPLSSSSFLRFLPSHFSCFFSLQAHMNVPSTMSTILPSLVSATHIRGIFCVIQECDQNADCFWFQNWTLILWKHQSSKFCSLAQMDVVRILSTELGVVSCATFWELWIYQRQLHQLISAKLRFTLPDLASLKPELLLSPCLNSAAEVYNADLT